MVFISLLVESKLVISFPSIIIDPSVTLSIPEIIFRIVDLPHPEEPNKVRNSPLYISKSRFLIISLSLYFFLSFLRLINISSILSPILIISHFLIFKTIRWYARDDTRICFKEKWN